jgi:hypothetical protein
MFNIFTKNKTTSAIKGTKKMDKELKPHAVSIDFSDENNYEINNNVLARLDGENFDAAYYMGDTEVQPSEDFDRIVIGEQISVSHKGRETSFSIGNVGSGSHISQSGGGSNTMQINGMSISTSGNKVSIKTQENNIVVEVNGIKYIPAGDKDVDSEKKTAAGTKELDLVAAKFKNVYLVIDEILISGSGKVTIRNSEKTIGANGVFAALVMGSGDINLNDLIGLNQCSLKVMGSGDISVKSSTFKSCDANVMGSGDILFDSACQATRMNISVMGSGDVSGRGMYVEQFNKKVMGSGDITGFKTKN